MSKTRLFIIVGVLWVACPAFAEDAGRMTKLKRGVTNVVTAPIEVMRETRAHWIEGSQYTDHISFWLFSGLVKGVVEAVKRAGSGAWDIVSFPFERPRGYEPLYKPDYVFQNWPSRDNVLPRKDL